MNLQSFLSHKKMNVAVGIRKDDMTILFDLICWNHLCFLKCL